jgi:hypothetical protein
MPWYVSWAPTPPNGRLGGIYSLPHNYSRWIEVAAFCWRAHRTVQCTSNIHYSLSEALPRQPTVGKCISRSLDPTVTQTVRCTPDSPVLQPESVRYGHLCAECPVSHRVVWCIPDRLLFTVRCANSVLADCPLHVFVRCFLGLLLFLSLWKGIRLTPIS